MIIFYSFVTSLKDQNTQIISSHFSFVSNDPEDLFAESQGKNSPSTPFPSWPVALYYKFCKFIKTWPIFKLSGLSSSSLSSGYLYLCWYGKKLGATYAINNQVRYETEKRNTPIYFNTNYRTEMKLVPIFMDHCLL